MSLQEQDNHTYSPPEEVFVVSSDFGEQSAKVDHQHILYAVDTDPEEISTEIDEIRALRIKLHSGRVATSGYTIDSTAAFLNEIGRYSLLDGKEEEAKLAKAIEAGNAAAMRLDEKSYESSEEQRKLELQIELGRLSKERFLTSNIRLVVSIAKRYSRPPSVELTDVIQEGILGLEHAIDKFDYTKGFKFSTYSSNWIKQHIGRFLALRAQSVKVPDVEFSSLRRALIHSANENSSLKDLPEKHHRLLSLINLVSLDMPIGEGDTDLIDVHDNNSTGPDVLVVDKNSQEVVHKIIDEVLTPRERAWITLYYGLDGEESLSMNKIAHKSGVSVQTVKTHILKAQTKLRSNKNIQELREKQD